MLGDEINRAPAKTQAALLEAMQERSVTVDGVVAPAARGFTVFATQNPIEFEGTYPLPEAELDRFLVKVVVGYPEEPVEQGILAARAGRLRGGQAGELRRRPGGGRRRAGAGCARPCRRVRVEPSLVAYITAIVRATRDRAGPHARRVAPRERRAAQDGAGLGAAGRAGLRRCPTT